MYLGEPFEIIFRKDENLDHVKVEFSAPEKTEEVMRAMEKLRDTENDVLLVTGSFFLLRAICAEE